MRKRSFKIGLIILTLFFILPKIQGQYVFGQDRTSQNPGHSNDAAYISNSLSLLNSAINPLIPPFNIKLIIADTFRVDLMRYWHNRIKKSIGGGKMSNMFAVADDIYINDTWIEEHDYYHTWDSKKVDPYGFDPVKFDDSLYIDLLSGAEHWTAPLKSVTQINSPFGFRRYRWHYGIDLDLERGDTVVAVADGIVRVAQYDRYGYGHYAVLRHKNGLETLYGHFLRRKVRVGQEIKKGDVIGFGGRTGRSTGYHLHFEVRYKGAAIDPNTVYDFETNELRDQVLTINPETFQYVKELRKKRYHRIRYGDTLSGISVRYRTSVSNLCRLNGISRNGILRVGKVLRVK